MSVYKNHFKKMLSLREQQIVGKYYRPLGIHKEQVAMTILECRRMGMSLDSVIEVFDKKIQIQNILTPEEELAWFENKIDSLSMEDKKIYDDLVKSSNIL